MTIRRSMIITVMLMFFILVWIKNKEPIVASEKENTFQTLEDDSLSKMDIRYSSELGGNISQSVRENSEQYIPTGQFSSSENKLAEETSSTLSDENEYTAQEQIITSIQEEKSLEEIIENELIKDWEEIPLNSESGVISNKNDTLKIGFQGRGMPKQFVGGSFPYTKLQPVGYSLTQDGSYLMTNGRNVDYIVYEDNKALYGNSTFLASSLSNLETKKVHYLKKENKLRQVSVDKEKKIIYAFDIFQTKNQKLQASFSMYNTDESKVRSFSFVVFPYYDSRNTVRSERNNTGLAILSVFGNTPKSETSYLYFKDNRGCWLGDTSDYNAYTESDGNIVNTFGNDFTKEGLGNKTFKDGELLAGDRNQYSGGLIQIGARPKSIQPGQRIQNTIQFYYGKLPPYMLLETSPTDYNIYEDNIKDLEGNYTLSDISSPGDEGLITFTFPDGTNNSKKYIADKNNSAEGTFIIPRTSFPEVLNSKPGTIKKYSTDVDVISDESEMLSDEYVIPINVYNMGAKALPQIIKKDTPFTKKAEEIIKDPVILPNHKALYEYEGELPDTSKVGTQTVKVRMTDQDQQEKITIINVPVDVIEGNPPMQGLYLVANDFQSSSDIFTDVTEEEVEQLILEKANARAWDISSGSSEGITISVESTTLTTNPNEGSYTANIKATKGYETVRKTIKIAIQSTQQVKVEFVDEAKSPLGEPIILEGAIGSTIDLTKEQEVQETIQKILDENYEIDVRPENETSIPVEKHVQTIQYKFKGRLFVQSSPKYFDFGRKSLGVPFIKIENARYDQPLIIWDNRKELSNWTLTATLKEPLTSVEDSSKQLPSALKYKVSGNETVDLVEGVSIPIAKNSHMKKGTYNISKDWEENQTGLLLETPAWKVSKPGKYRANILWKVEQTP